MCDNLSGVGAALGQRSMLRNSVETGTQFCPYPLEVQQIVRPDRHEIKLRGETGESCGRVTLPKRERHGS